MKWFLSMCFLSLSLSANLELYSTIEPPQQFEEKGKLTGLGIDTVDAIQKEIGSNAPVHIFPWARSMAIAKKNKNTAIFLGGISRDRQPYFIAIGPVLKKRYILYGKSTFNTPVSTLEDAMKVNSIASMYDDVRIRFMESRGFTNLKPTTDHIEGLKLLINERVLLWSSSDWEVGANLELTGITPKEIKPVLTLYESGTNILINNKSDPKLIQKWQDALRKIKDNGTLQKIAKKWSAKLGLNLYFDKQSDAIVIR